MWFVWLPSFKGNAGKTILHKGGCPGMSQAGKEGGGIYLRNGSFLLINCIRVQDHDPNNVYDVKMHSCFRFISGISLSEGSRSPDMVS